MKTDKILYLFVAMMLVSCSMTKGIPDNDQLFTGLKKISYTDELNYDDEAYQNHIESTKEELEAALATVPNGSLFGSSRYTVPWSWHLYIYNKYSGKESAFAKWMVKAFGKPPILMSKVNPALRASVARSVLQNNGFFRGNVTYEAIPQKNPKKCKLSYTVEFDSLYTLDSMAYVNFPSNMQTLLDSTKSETLLKRGDPFSVASLDGERSRITTLFRNNGYYFYNTGYSSYLADTFAIDNQTQLRLQLADGLPDGALKKWYIGKIDVQFRKNIRDQLTDSISRRYLTIHYNGKKSPIRPGVVLRDIRLRPRQEYSYEKYLESASRINSNGVFSRTDFLFTPRPDTDTLDLTLNCVFDKPYDFYIEGNMIGRTNGRYGPLTKIGFTKRNAFRAGEKLDINLHGSYEFSTKGDSKESNYQYGAEVSVEFPRLLIPFYNPMKIKRDKNGRIIRRRPFYAAPSTLAKISTDIIRRPDYYKMHIVTGEWTYRWQPTETSQHEYSPLTLKYQFKNSSTDKFESVLDSNPYLRRTMGDFFIPKMRYTYTYKSPSTVFNPIRWETTIEESGNVLSLIDRIRGYSFNEKEKKWFKNPYAQLIRLETNFTKTWHWGSYTSLVGHLNAGFIFSYGNSIEAPLSEEFYVGGANSIRAFNIRDLGPGRFDIYAHSDYGQFNNIRQMAYLIRNGDMKLVGNLEYRTRLSGNLHGAIFLDAGNVWRMKGVDIEASDFTDDEEGKEDYEFFSNWFEDMKFKPSHFFEDIALGTGVGLRYDLGFLVIRLDWGIALHTPYDTGKSGYFNIANFKDSQCFHFAIGYPF